MAIVSSYTRYEWDLQGGWKSVEEYVDGVILYFHDDPCVDEELAEETPPKRHWRYYRRNDDGHGWYFEDEDVEVIPEDVLNSPYRI